VSAKLTLAECVYSVRGMRLVIDRDVNAARNLLELAIRAEGPAESRHELAVPTSVADGVCCRVRSTILRSETCSCSVGRNLAG
jgi:transposase